MEPYWDLIKRIVIESDLVLEILDARLIELSRNSLVEAVIKDTERPVIFVINKSDLVSKDTLKKDVVKLKKEGEVVFVSAKQKSSGRLLYTAIKRVFKEHGKRVKEFSEQKPQFREAIGDIVVAVVGYPNVGKSSIINLLAHKKKVKVSKKSGTTHGVHWIKATDEIKLIDSPGVIPLDKDDDLRYGLIGARDSESLRDPAVVAEALVKLFIKKNKKAFEDFYKITIEKEDPEIIIKELAEKKSFFLKGGIADENRASNVLIRDWQQGRLRL